ncbi:hypothetical protein ABER61_16095 [Brevibacillus formosus]|uniref:Tail fiber protein n=1 Tax=Brevibacillus formosus TaxID=54913 RepID=A0ABQ0T7T2_9BACL|nr:hypothetical protein [Brevibacillus formosus]MED1958059.1 hypothetical protein [Brevibacillus formosus]PSJ89222.1 hypothetical protein C7R91_27650 [Brevibacillus formosus]GED59381.1 hypothetical protein BFO01nite_35130 [Brevibacillus formosus]
MAQLPSTASIKDIITSLQTMECINQKADLASVVGSPAASTDDVATIITKIQNAKNTLAANITAKGTVASGSESVQTLVNKVGLLSGVKKWASGTISTDANGNLTVTGLGFMPSVIVLHARESTSRGYAYYRKIHLPIDGDVTIYNVDGSGGYKPYSLNRVDWTGQYLSDFGGGGVGGSAHVDLKWSITTSGFSTKFLVTSSIPVTYYAFE